MSDNLLKANRELSDLQQECGSLAKQIREEYERVMQEFENEYPPLNNVEKISFTPNEFQEAFLRLRKRRIDTGR